MKTQSEFNHYYVNDALFILYDEALDYCDKHQLSYDLIETTKHYKTMKTTSVTASNLMLKAEQNPMGFTMDANGIEVTSDYTRYVVGLKMTKESHNLEGAEHCVEVMDFILDEELYPRENVGFGGWLDTKTNTYHFDVVTFCVDLETALNLAEVHEQLAIFDLETMQEIRL
jgi:hypothetical protein